MGRFHYASVSREFTTLLTSSRSSAIAVTAPCAMSVEILSAAAQLHKKFHLKKACNRWMTLKITQVIGVVFVTLSLAVLVGHRCVKKWQTDVRRDKLTDKRRTTAYTTLASRCALKAPQRCRMRFVIVRRDARFPFESAQWWALICGEACYSARS